MQAEPSDSTSGPPVAVYVSVDAMQSTPGISLIVSAPVVLNFQASCWIARVSCFV